MKKLYFYLLSSVIIFSLNAQISHQITNSGLNYTPAELTVQQGDTVIFNVGSFHPTLQVSESTWNSNGSTALEGGFDFPDGTGTIIIENTETIYYICTAHISSGMKGVIMVNPATSITQSNVSYEPEIYPNPVTGDEIKIKFRKGVPNELQIALYDLTGKKVVPPLQIVSDGNNEVVTVQFIDLQPGLYFIQ
ncbi:MAG: T9SS type A sorting domain-containing protein [Bacteroidales bacterium]|nr:T9SS type A sorting domain-containing protein [Bacteroidales bacterium]